MTSGTERWHIMCPSASLSLSRRSRRLPPKGETKAIFAETRMYYSYTYYYENWCLNILLPSNANLGRRNVFPRSSPSRQFRAEQDAFPLGKKPRGARLPRLLRRWVLRRGCSHSRITSLNAVSLRIPLRSESAAEECKDLKFKCSLASLAGPNWVLNFSCPCEGIQSAGWQAICVCMDRVDVIEPPLLPFFIPIKAHSHP